MTVNVTSGGSDRGARPILERHWDVVEKDEVWAGNPFAKAGARKVGTAASLVLDVSNIDRRARDEPLRHMGRAIATVVRLCLADTAGVVVLKEQHEVS